MRFFLAFIILCLKAQNSFIPEISIGKYYNNFGVILGLGDDLLGDDLEIGSYTYGKIEGFIEYKFNINKNQLIKTRLGVQLELGAKQALGIKIKLIYSMIETFLLIKKNNQKIYFQFGFGLIKNFDQDYFCEFSLGMQKRERNKIKNKAKYITNIKNINKQKLKKQILHEQFYDSDIQEQYLKKKITTEEQSTRYKITTQEQSSRKALTKQASQENLIQEEQSIRRKIITQEKSSTKKIIAQFKRHQIQQNLIQEEQSIRSQITKQEQSSRNKAITLIKKIDQENLIQKEQSIRCQITTQEKSSRYKIIKEKQVFEDVINNRRKFLFLSPFFPIKNTTKNNLKIDYFINNINNTPLGDIKNKSIEDIASKYKESLSQNINNNYYNNEIRLSNDDLDLIMYKIRENQANDKLNIMNCMQIIDYNEKEIIKYPIIKDLIEDLVIKNDQEIFIPILQSEHYFGIYIYKQNDIIKKVKLNPIAIQEDATSCGFLVLYFAKLAADNLLKPICEKFPNNQKLLEKIQLMIKPTNDETCGSIIRKLILNFYLN